MGSVRRATAVRVASVAAALAVGMALVVVLALPAGAGTRSRTVFRDRADTAGPLDLSRVSLRQRGRGLVISFAVRGRIVGRALGPLPRPGDKTPHYLCLLFHRHGKSSSRRLCLGRRAKRPWKLGVEKVGAGGKVHSARSTGVRMLTAKRTKVRALLKPAAAGLAVGGYRVHATSAWSGPACKTLAACRDRAPSGRSPAFDLRPVRLAGCNRAGIGVASNGPTGKHEVALTFDDGPSTYTHSVLSILNEDHIHGTFFEIGEQVSGNSGVMNQILDSGDEIGDHTFHHVPNAGYGEIASAQNRIESATGFRTCLFRPPDGVYNSGTVAAATRLGMSTIIWNVDPRDWSRPGTGAIYSRVVSATRPGSIVIMHDGGGDRSETVAALPGIIRTLKSRGYHLVTVSKLLGQPMRWRPVR